MLKDNSAAPWGAGSLPVLHKLRISELTDTFVFLQNQGTLIAEPKMNYRVQNGWDELWLLKYTMSSYLIADFGDINGQRLCWELDDQLLYIWP